MTKQKQFKQLLILAGPSGTGKSTLIKALKKGKLSFSISQHLKLNNLSIFPIFHNADIPKIKSKKFEESIILHYDLYDNYLYKNHHIDITQIIKQFDEVTVVTLYVPTEILIKRIRLRLIRTYIRTCLEPWNYLQRLKYKKYRWKKYRQYKQTNFVSKLYQEWFEFTKASWVLRHLILDSSVKELKIISPSEFIS